MAQVNWRDTQIWKRKWTLERSKFTAEYSGVVHTCQVSIEASTICGVLYFGTQALLIIAKLSLTRCPIITGPLRGKHLMTLQ